MTVVKKSYPTKYLSTSDVALIYEVYYKAFVKQGEPIEPWSSVNKSNIDTLVNLPKSSYFGFNAYKSLAEKAAIMFYKINKGHIFPNGNKRLSVAITLVFLGINKADLKSTPDELTKKALEIALSSPSEFEQTKTELTRWFEENIVRLSD